MNIKGIRLLAPFALATAATLGATLGQPAAQAAPQTVGETQLVTTDGDNLEHTIRHSDGTWQRMGAIPGYENVSQITSAIVNGEENVIVQGASGQSTGSQFADRLVRHSDGNWTYHASLPAIPDMPATMSAVNVNGHLDLVVLTRSGPQVSELDSVTDTWSAFSAIPTDGHKLASVAAATDGQKLRVVELFDDGRTIAVTDRTSSGWTALDTTTTGLSDRQVTTKIAAAQTGGLLQIVTLNHPADAPSGENYLEHGIVDGGGRWSGFAEVDLRGQGTPWDFAMTAANGSMQLAYRAEFGNAIYHTIRWPNGSWQTPGNLLDATGGDAQGPVTIAGE